MYVFQDLAGSIGAYHIVMDVALLVKEMTNFILTITNTNVDIITGLVRDIILFTIETLLVISLVLVPSVLMLSPIDVVLKTVLKYLLNILAML